MESYYDFTYDKDLWNGLPEFVDDIHSMGMKYVIILVCKVLLNLFKIHKIYMATKIALFAPWIRHCFFFLMGVLFQDHCIGSDLEIIDRDLNGTYLPYSQGIEMDIFIRDPRNPDEYLVGNLWYNIDTAVNVHSSKIDLLNSQNC